MTIYSTQFIADLAAATTNLTFDVPEGYIAVVRSISMLPTASGLTDAYVAIAGLTYIWGITSAMASVGQYWNGRQVLNAGQQLQTHNTGTSAYWMISGYLLSL